MLNVAVIMGRLTADPELHHTPNDIAVTTFTLAVERGYVKTGAEKQVDFIDIVAWRNTAEFICKYFQKGRRMAVHGSIQTRTYTDKDGTKRKAFEIVASSVNFADSKQTTTQTGGNATNSPVARPQTSSPPYAAVPGGLSADILDDDYSNVAFGEIPLPDDGEDLPF